MYGLMSYLFPQTCLINSRMHEYSCKILYMKVVLFVAIESHICWLCQYVTIYGVMDHIPKFLATQRDVFLFIFLCIPVNVHVMLIANVT